MKLEYIEGKAEQTKKCNPRLQATSLRERLNLKGSARPERTLRSRLLENEGKLPYLITQTLYCRFGEHYAEVVSRGDQVNHSQLETLARMYKQERLHVGDSEKTRADHIATFKQLYRTL